MTTTDIAELSGYLIGLFGIGFSSGYLLMAFHALVKLITR